MSLKFGEGDALIIRSIDLLLEEAIIEAGEEVALSTCVWCGRDYDSNRGCLNSECAKIDEGIDGLDYTYSLKYEADLFKHMYGIR